MLILNIAMKRVSRISYSLYMDLVKNDFNSKSLSRLSLTGKFPGKVISVMIIDYYMRLLINQKL